MSRFSIVNQQINNAYLKRDTEIMINVDVYNILLY